MVTQDRRSLNTSSGHKTVHCSMFFKVILKFWLSEILVGLSFFFKTVLTVKNYSYI